ncbi:MAG: hypothetical protein KF774_11505 [Planctomyces sp.]|nr:hypothetical protein [Planctomyces sp.]
MQRSFALLAQSLRMSERRIGIHLVRAILLLPPLAALFIVLLESRLGRGWGQGGLVLAEFLLVAAAVQIGLAGSFFMATWLTDEKEQGTLGLLLMTAASPATLLAGAPLARAIQTAWLLALTAPLWLMAIPLGGVSAERILGALVPLACLLAFASQVGTFFSVVCSTSVRSSLATLATLLLTQLFPAGLGTFSAGMLASGTQHSAFFQRCVAVSEVVQPWTIPFQAEQRLRGLAPGVSLLAITTSYLAASALLFGAACWLFERRLTHEPASRAGRLSRASVRGWNLFSTRGRVVGEAIAWKDFQQFSGGPRLLRIRFAIFGALPFVTLAILLAKNPQAFQTGEAWRFVGSAMCIAGWYSIVLETLIQSVRVFQCEVRDGTWDTLRLVPQTLGELCRRKLAGASRGLAAGALSIAVGALVLLYGELFVLPGDPWAELQREFTRLRARTSAPELVGYGLMVVLGAANLLLTSCLLSLRINPWLSLVIAQYAFLPTVLPGWGSVALGSLTRSLPLQTLAATAGVLITALFARLLLRDISARLSESQPPK